jgi:hypothetical protein
MNERGLSFYEPHSFDEVPTLLAEVGKQFEHPMTALKRNDFTLGQAFWLFLRKEGKCIASISAKLTDLNGEAFGSYIRRTTDNQYDVPSGSIRSVAEALDQRLSGRLIYFGGIEFSANERGSRAILADFSQFARLLGASYWEFDWMYTIIAYKHRRLADDYGFHWRIRNALEWRDPAPTGRENSQMFLLTEARDFAHDLRAVQPGEL